MTRATEAGSRTAIGKTALRWIDTALCQAILREMERHDQAQAHPLSVMPRGGLVGALIALTSGLIILVKQLSPEGPGFFVAIFVPPVFLLFCTRAVAKPIMERRQLRLNDEISQRDRAKGTFFFYLRPFREDGRRPVTTRAASGGVALLFGFEMDFEFMLSQALR